MTDTPVTQADREAAFSYYLFSHSLKADDYRAVDWRARLDSGERDGSEIVQAFARHRISSTASSVDREELARTVLHAIPTIKGGWNSAYKITDAILAVLTDTPAASSVDRSTIYNHIAAAIGHNENGIFIDVDRATDAIIAALAASSHPKINIRCETTDGEVSGSTGLNVLRVEREDDGSFTAVTDYWPSSHPASAGDETLRKAAQALVAKLDECDVHIADAFLIREMKCGPYEGPNYSTELRDLRAALSVTPALTVDETERLREALEAISVSSIYRDPKWSGMNAHDIARAALSTDKGEASRG